MTTPESSTPPDSATTSGRRGFNWRNKWVLIGGSIAVVVAVVVIVAAVMLTAGSGVVGGNGSALKMLSDDTEVLVMIDMAAIRNNEDNFPGDYDDFADDMQQRIDDALDTQEVAYGQVDSYILAGNSRTYEEMLLIQGDVAFSDIQDDWEDQGFQDDSYQGYDIWDGDDYYVLVEKHSAVIVSDSEQMIRDVIKIIDRESGSVEDDPDGNLARIIARLDSSPIKMAATGDAAEGCGAWVDGCVGYGAGYSGADPQREEITAGLVVVFSSERRAERAVDDYDQVANFMEDMLDNIARQVDNFTSPARVGEVDVDEISADGEFVFGVGFIEIDAEQ